MVGGHRSQVIVVYNRNETERWFSGVHSTNEGNN